MARLACGFDCPAIALEHDAAEVGEVSEVDRRAGVMWRASGAGRRETQRQGDIERAQLAAMHGVEPLRAPGRPNPPSPIPFARA